MEGDLLSSLALASILRTQNARNESPTQQVQGVQVGITSDQINQLSDSIGQAVRGAVQGIDLPPAQVQFPSNLQLSFSDAELARFAQAITPTQSAKDLKSRIYQRTILIDISPTSIPDSTFIYAEFPAGQKVASFQFSQQAGLIGVTLSASIVNTQTKPCGFFCALADTPVLNFDTTPYTSNAQVGTAKSPDSQILLSVFTHQNSTATTINPNTRSASLSFGLDDAVQIVNSQATLSLYAFQTADVVGVSGLAGQLMSAVLTAYYIPTEE
jgi:hypothetical protein